MGRELLGQLLRYDTGEWRLVPGLPLVAEHTRLQLAERLSTGSEGAEHPLDPRIGEHAPVRRAPELPRLAVHAQIMQHADVAAVGGTRRQIWHVAVRGSKRRAWLQGRRGGASVAFRRRGGGHVHLYEQVLHVKEREAELHLGTTAKARAAARNYRSCIYMPDMPRVAFNVMLPPQVAAPTTKTTRSPSPHATRSRII